MKLLRVAQLALAALPVLAVARPAEAGSLEPRTPSWTSVSYVEEAVIAATPAQVWQVLTDLAGYPAWNPWIVKAEGPLAPGATVWVDLHSGGSTTRYEHTVLVVEPTTRFCWKDAGWNAWFVYGQRCRWLTLQADGMVHFRQELLIDGVLSWLADLTQGKALRAGMVAETAALKAAAEAL